MRLFGEVNVLRGSMSWGGLLRPRSVEETPQRPAAAAQREFDEEGRLFVFRFARKAPQRRSFDFDRIFEYMKHRALPDEGVRQIRRDARNAVDIFTVR